MKYESRCKAAFFSSAKWQAGQVWPHLHCLPERAGPESERLSKAC